MTWSPSATRAAMAARAASRSASGPTAQKRWLTARPTEGAEGSGMGRVLRRAEGDDRVVVGDGRPGLAVAGRTGDEHVPLGPVHLQGPRREVDAHEVADVLPRRRRQPDPGAVLETERGSVGRVDVDGVAGGAD